jgi:flagellar motor component MotA
MLLKEMMLEGVIGIVEGLNPTLIRMKLASYDLEPAAKPKVAKAAKAEAKPAAAKPAPKKEATAA